MAPENFSLLTNTDEMLSFFESIQESLEHNRHPVLDMREVQSIGPDAIAALNSTVQSANERYQIPISGTEPRIQAIAETLRQSGFYDYVTPPANVNYRAAASGLISHEEAHANVDGPTARRLIHFAMNRLSGTPAEHPPSYSALGEFMHNTFDHASRQVTGKERWWASVYYDDQLDAAHFTFLDNGVGIFGSRPVRLLHSLRAAITLGGAPQPVESDPELLMLIFQGRVASATGIPWRGQGLPRIYRRVKLGQLTDLTVITNGVKASLDTDNFSKIGHDFPGTLYHWEVRKS